MTDQAVPSPTIPAPDASGSTAQILIDRRAPQRDQLLAGIAALRNGTQPGAPAAAAPAPAPAATPTPEPAAPAPDPEPTEESATDPEPTPEPAAAEPAGMAALRKQEQHLRRQIAQERSEMAAEFDRQKAAWQTRLSKADELEAKIAGARKDPLAALAALGFSEADYESVGRALYAASPEGRKDPRHAEAAAKALERRAQETEVERLRHEMDEFRTQQTQAQQQAAVEAQLYDYYESITGALGDDSPHARLLVGKQPRSAQAKLLEVADRLYTESGPSHDLREMPSPADVLKAYEAQRVAEIRATLDELAALGIDPATFGKPKAPAPKAPAAAPAPAPAKGAAPAPAPEPTILSAPPPVIPAPTNQRPTREDAIAGLRALRTA